MPVHLEITDHAGYREVTVDQDSFWVGTAKSGCAVELDLPGAFGRILEVRVTEEGRLQIRAEAGLPFPVRTVTGNLGARFTGLMEGDVVNAGTAMVKMRALAGEGVAQELDPSLLKGDAPGAPVGSWYQTFMEVADHLEGLTAPEKMIVTSMEAILNSTGADRVHIGLEDGAAFYLSRGGSLEPFRFSHNLVDQARRAGRVVHVPVASADPVASRFGSVRREGISSSIAMPIKALGKVLGVLYADCVRDTAVLTAGDLQRVAFMGRLLASSLGNRQMVSQLVRAEPTGEEAKHPALQTSSPAYADVVERVKLYAPTDYTVLIRGETGTGKEVVAHCLHELSHRSDGPFVPVNCAAIPEQLMESVLFGHEKGAFTGATSARRGHFEAASGGTILLDEIGDMAHDLQAKILRVLQDRVVMPVGSRRQVEVDVRILAATHQDLENAVSEGRFREDLYYRLRELEISLPPLRERREDILGLCNKFLTEAAAELRLERPPELLTETLDHLHRHPWRGNIRELRHLVKGAALRAAGGPIRVAHLDVGESRPLGGAAAEKRAPAAEPTNGEAASAPVDGSQTWKERLEAQERAALIETLEAADGNLTRAAELFGVPRTTYREKLVKNGLLQERGNERPKG